MSDLIALARRHKHIAPTHYEGCEADHIGCLVNKLADEIEGLRAQLEERYIAMRVRQLEHALDAERQTVRRLRAALQEFACSCSSLGECESTWDLDGECRYLTARNALEASHE